MTTLTDVTRHSTVNPIVGGLTREDIKAIKATRRVCFDHLGDRVPAGRIRLINADILWDDRDETVLEVPSRIAAFSKSHFTRDSVTEHGFDRAFAMEYAEGWRNVWSAVAEFVRLGDQLYLEWLADNNSQVVEKSGLHADSLYLIVTRPNYRKLRGQPSIKDSTRHYSFLLATSLCENNTARMVRRGPWNTNPIPEGF